MLRVLIVEDEPVNQHFLLLALRKHGDCLAVGTGEACLEACSKALDQGSPFDVVFLDIQLPGINGLKTLELLRALEDERGISEAARAQVIVTTVLDDHQTASRAFIQGHAASFLTKPFRSGQIEEELSKLGLVAA